MTWKEFHNSRFMNVEESNVDISVKEIFAIVLAILDLQGLCLIVALRYNSFLT